jgi:putative acetyltransferase
MPAIMLEITDYEPAHRDAVVAVVKAVHAEYGFSWDEHGYHRDLYDVPGRYLAEGGAFWVLKDVDRVVGCAGVTVDGSVSELHRLYLLKEYRGQGQGRRMLEHALAYARGRGCRRMIAWSDVLLRDAHALYRKLGFVEEGQRICDDPDKSLEHGFWKEPI